MTRCRVSVAKIGGSLLSKADLAAQLRKWFDAELATHPETHYVLIVGGGRLVDRIREIDCTSPLGDANAHWICIELMSVITRILAALLPELTVVHQFSQLAERTNRPGATLLCPGDFLKNIEPTGAGTRLPADWSVTSDAIAARLAIVLDAHELVLVKSVAPPVPCNDCGDWLRELAELGYVDRFLPRLTQSLPPMRFALLEQP
jgi:5-(aminomethyl)-3-furanmethanol phosphate kinase